jgi:predicted phage gp36 major capsid-like protein
LTCRTQLTAHPRSRVPVHQAEKLKAEMRKTREEVTVSYDLLLSWEEREQREQEEKIPSCKKKAVPQFFY